MIGHIFFGLVVLFLFYPMIYFFKSDNNKLEGNLKRIDTFALTNDKDEIKKSKSILEKIARKCNRKLSDMDISFKKIHIEGQYGETSN